jgi:hypothetical protein
MSHNAGIMRSCRRERSFPEVGATGVPEPASFGPERGRAGDLIDGLKDAAVEDAAF